MAMSGGKDDGEPMMEINTTPLIDVMLVLLIMFIITIPVATHAVNIDLPSPTPPNQPNPPPIKRDKNNVSVSDGGDVLWNGGVVSQGELVFYLKETTKLKPEPELQFQPTQDAPYDTAAKVLQIIKASEVSAFGFVGNEQYSEFGKAPNAPKAKM